ncbi:MAG TPA: matrixin family metalloprotease [Pyrinomonadaceae bacterium]|nr:matrixin family metalloprotease [Pyrinomonadaceae bacterium]
MRSGTGVPPVKHAQDARATTKLNVSTQTAMIRKAISALTTMVLMLGASLPASAYSLHYHDASGIVARRWLANPIIVAFSRSLSAPPPNIKVGSDVIGAAQRALQHWAAVANIQFLETSSSAVSISPQNAGDGVNLITVSIDNLAAFGASDSPGRTRVFYDSGGAIVEADIALNPAETFSSDGTAGTYDLESTFTHEVGHLLGLEHSAVIGATMQPRQAKNGVYGLPALTQRALSADDIAGARALYGSAAETGSISGKLLVNRGGGAATANTAGVVVFAEEFETGKVVAGAIASVSGDYQLGGLAPGSYRLIAQSANGLLAGSDIGAAESESLANSSLVRAFEISRAPLVVKSGVNLSAAPVFLLSNDPPATIRPRMIGLNAELSTVAVPLEAGKTFTMYVGGEGVDQIAETGISISSPLIKVVPETLSSEEFATPYPVISFQVTVALDATAGDYSIRLQSVTGELSYLAGAITIKP